MKMDRNSETELSDSQQPSCSNWKDDVQATNNASYIQDIVQSNDASDHAMYCRRYETMHMVDGDIVSSPPINRVSATFAMVNDYLKRANIVFPPLESDEVASTAIKTTTTTTRRNVSRNSEMDAELSDDNAIDSLGQQCKFLKVIPAVTPGVSGVMDDENRVVLLNEKPGSVTTTSAVEPSSKIEKTMQDHDYISSSQSRLDENGRKSSFRSHPIAEEHVSIQRNSQLTGSKQSPKTNERSEDVRAMSRKSVCDVELSTSKRVPNSTTFESDSGSAMDVSETEQEDSGELTSSSSSASTIPDGLILEETPPSQQQRLEKMVVVQPRCASPILGSFSSKSSMDLMTTTTTTTVSSSSTTTDSLPCHQPIRTASSTIPSQDDFRLSAEIDSTTADPQRSTPFEVFNPTKRRRVGGAHLFNGKESSRDYKKNCDDGRHVECGTIHFPVLMSCAPVLDDVKRDQLLRLQFPADTMVNVWTFLCKSLKRPNVINSTSLDDDNHRAN